MPDINEDLLMPAGMAAAHAALIAKYEWFLHVKPISKFEGIKAGGLEPGSQGCAMKGPITTAIGKSADKIIFLQPLGTFDSTPRRGEKLFAMALHRDALPKTLTVDWTFDGTWTLGPIIKAGAPNCPNEEIFCEVVRRRGSVAIYQAIPPELLRVWTKDTLRDDSSNWLELVKTDFERVRQVARCGQNGARSDRAAWDRLLGKFACRRSRRS